MRIEFPHTAREDVLWDVPELTVGSAPDNAVVLASHQAAPRHLRLTRDRRGCVLQVLAGAARVYVNARPVRERALLRAGDVLTVGDCRMLLKADGLPSGREPLSVPERARCPVALRSVAGPLSGRVYPLHERLDLGASAGVPLELPQGEEAVLQLYWQDSQLRLRLERACERYPLRVNGVETGELSLHPGDQIGIATHRFIVDAPGMQPEPALAPPPAIRDLLPEEQAGPRGEVWWLIVTAAVLALGIAMVLLIRL